MQCPHGSLTWRTGVRSLAIMCTDHWGWCGTWAGDQWWQWWGAEGAKEGGGGEVENLMGHDHLPGLGPYPCSNFVHGASSMAIKVIQRQNQNDQHKHHDLMTVHLITEMATYFIMLLRAVCVLKRTRCFISGVSHLTFLDCFRKGNRR